MRKLNKFVIALLFASAITSVHAAADKSKLYSDVPTSHWAYKAVEDLTQKGLIVGMPNGTFKGNKPLTRYSFAVVVSRMLERYAELTENGNFVSQKDLKTLEDLVSEFVTEIESISEDIKTIKADVSDLKTDVKQNKTDISELKEKNSDIDSRLENLGKVKVTGDILVQNLDYKKTAKNMDDFQNVQVRIGFNAKPSDKVEADFRYVAYDKDLDSNRDPRDYDRMLPENPNNPDPNRDYNGTSKSIFGRARGENKVEIAKVKVNKVFNENDYIQVGRDFMTHGHALVINDYADAVTYSTKAGDVTVTGNAIFADYDNGANPNKKGKQIWNLNADTKVKSHNIYAGVYVDQGKDFYNVNASGTVILINQGNGSTTPYQFKDVSCVVTEVGSSGNLTSDGKVKYDAAMVASSIERKNMENLGKKDKATGYLWHAALGYDASPNFNLKAAYTTADKNFDGIISLDKNQGSVDGHTTPFDDIARYQNLLGGMLVDNFANTSDLKLQFEYSFANNQSIRFAYDIVKENHNRVKSGFTPNGNYCDNWNMTSNFYDPVNDAYNGYNKLDAKISTLEYKYRFDPSTRLSLGFTNADKSGCRDEANEKVKDEKLFWTEVYSKF